MNQLDFKGRTAVVTGGMQGIGAAIVKRLKASGAEVVVWDLDGSPKVDVSDPSSIQLALKNVKKVDVLVNNAGIAGPTGKVEEIAAEDWERCIAVDLNGMFYCTRRAMPLIKQAGGGSVINLSSVAGRLGFPMRTPYAAAKWAVVGFTKSLAIEAGPEKVRVNCIQPGNVEGERIDRVIDAKAKALGIRAEEMKNRLLDTVSLRTFVSPQDIANMALFLATDAGRHITGQALSVCGDVQRTV
jgi:NAD(P)-dependent dehydrogenase (short-subunit alcohol dehydrogenase family)